MKQWLLFAFAGLMILGCRRDSSVNSVLPVTQHYYVYYNLTANETQMRASFYHQDSHTILPSGYSITANDSSMAIFQSQTSSSSGANYYYERTDSGMPDAHFRLKREDGTILHNIIPSNVVGLISVNYLTNAVSMSDTLVLHVTTDSLNSGEVVSVDILQSSIHYSFQSLPYNSGDTTITILPNHMINLIPGAAELKVSRQSPVMLLLEYDGTGSGDMFATSYVTQDITIVQ